MDGWVSIHRDVWSNWVWHEKPFSKGQAWVDLILLMNYAPAQIIIDLEQITIDRGEHFSSETKLSDRWGWSRKKTHAFLERLASGQMLGIKRHGKGTVYKVLNYSVWQDVGTEKEQERNRLGTGEEPVRHTNNKNNNISTLNNLPETPLKSSSVFRDSPEAEAWQRYNYELIQYLDLKKEGGNPPYPVKPGETFEEAQLNKYRKD